MRSYSEALSFLSGEQPGLEGQGVAGGEKETKMRARGEDGDGVLNVRNSG